MRNLFWIFIFGCSSCAADCHPVVLNWANKGVKSAQWKHDDHSWLVPFDRTEILLNLKEKIDSGIPLVVHTLVPLCDNNFQGIAPTSTSLGDGFNLKTNLYWATRHGMKRYFADHPKWTEKEVSYYATDTILERVVFEQKFENGATVMLVCDAYRGDRMQECLSDYFMFLSGKKTDSVCVNGANLSCGKDADLLVFNGHNGIYEVSLDSMYAVNKRQKDAAVIACSSYWNFAPVMRIANCYPLVTTTESMYPGATVLDKIIEKWALLSDAETVRFAAASGYHEMKNCGINPADKMFYSGW